MALLAVILASVAAWCAYDGAIAFPEQNRRWDVYSQRFANDYEGWLAYTRQHGWPEGQPNRYSRGEIISQWIGVGVCGLGGLWVGLLIARRKKQPITADDTGFVVAGGRVEYAEIERIDKSLWERKGLAWVHYQRDGQARLAKIDAYVFLDAPTVLERIERATGLG